MRNLDPAAIVKFKHKDTYKPHHLRPDHITQDDILAAIADAEQQARHSLPKCPGLYLILNRTTRRLYVGRSRTCIKSRVGTHFSLLKRDKVPNPRWRSDYLEHGADSFGVAVLTLADPAWGHLAECKALSLIHAFDNYNIVGQARKGQRVDKAQTPLNINPARQTSPNPHQEGAASLRAKGATLG